MEEQRPNQQSLDGPETSIMKKEKKLLNELRVTVKTLKNLTQQVKVDGVKEGVDKTVFLLTQFTKAKVKAAAERRIKLTKKLKESLEEKVMATLSGVEERLSNQGAALTKLTTVPPPFFELFEAVDGIGKAVEGRSAETSGLGRWRLL